MQSGDACARVRYRSSASFCSRSARSFASSASPSFSSSFLRPTFSTAIFSETSTRSNARARSPSSSVRSFPWMCESSFPRLMFSMVPVKPRMEVEMWFA